ncbi:hypothetical protein [Streptomyces sp. NBC_00893]|uniref:hypothetical protein n=1 Tax=Streptomyces sp. NBC_00893 TaxID=2975862 RepID=UPI00225BB2FB|nr:hypothetical protein [Streptomyces sp. NBC_00893]MCX4851660.1 hypothetical protein [Streptomyces sp. NBC_00893]
MAILSRTARRASTASLALAARFTASPALASASEAPTKNGTAAALDPYCRQHLGWGSRVTGPVDTTGRDLDKAGVQCADVTVPSRAARGTAPTPLSPEFAAALRYPLHGSAEPSGVRVAVLCGDVAAPRDPEVYWRDIERGRAAHPVFGPMTDIHERLGAT